jgi:alpha-1,6-mannosyltransferase
MCRRSWLLFSFALACEIVFFAALNFFDDWTLESMPIKFVGAAFLAGVAYLIAVSHFPSKDEFGAANKIHLGTRKQAIVFWMVAVTLRLIALPLTPGDDLWRYEWEGKIQQAGFNPYVVAPDDPKLDDLRHGFPASSKINHPEFPAIYPPGAEMLFRFFSAISDRLLFYKLLFAVADLATAFLLLRLIGGEERYATAAWYAWNPLVAYSFAGATHFDSLMILPLVGGILCLVRSEIRTKPGPKWTWALGAAVLFGIAISIKLVPALLLLLCVFALRWRAIVLVVSGAIPAALSLPYGFPRVRIWEAFDQFAYVARLNDLFWWLIEDTVWPNPHQKNYHYNVILIVCVILVSLIFIRNWKRGMLWAFGVALVLSPVLHAWYCTWILPLATWRRAHAWHVLSVTIFAYYLFWDPRLFMLPWHSEPWMRALIIAPVLAALVMLLTAKKAKQESITE